MAKSRGCFVVVVTCVFTGFCFYRPWVPDLAPESTGTLCSTLTFGFSHHEVFLSTGSLGAQSLSAKVTPRSLTGFPTGGQAGKPRLAVASFLICTESRGIEGENIVSLFLVPFVRSCPFLFLQACSLPPPCSHVYSLSLTFSVLPAQLMNIQHSLGTTSECYFTTPCCSPNSS